MPIHYFLSNNYNWSTNCFSSSSFLLINVSSIKVTVCEWKYIPSLTFTIKGDSNHERQQQHGIFKHKNKEELKKNLFYPWDFIKAVWLCLQCLVIHIIQLVQWMWKHILGQDRGDQEQTGNERTGQSGLKQDRTGRSWQQRIQPDRTAERETTEKDRDWAKAKGD